MNLHINKELKFFYLLNAQVKQEHFFQEFKNIVHHTPITSQLLII
jgi:hypothetical protein